MDGSQAVIAHTATSSSIDSQHRDEHRQNALLHMLTTMIQGSWWYLQNLIRILFWNITRPLMYGRTTFLAPKDLHARLKGAVIVDWRSSKVLSSISSIPNDGNSGKASKHSRGVVHGTGFNREGNGHAKDDDGEDDPDDANAIDERAKLAKRVGRVLDDLPASHHVDSDRDTIGGRETDGSDTSERVKSSRRAKVDTPKDAVNDSREDESIDRHVETVVDLTPELVSGNGTVSGESIGAARRSGEGTNACEHKNAKNEEEETEATSRRTSNNLEQGTDRLGVGDREEHLDIGKDEENGDEVNNSRDTGGSDGEDDGLGDLTFGVLDLFTHGSDHAVASQDIGTYWLGMVSDRLIRKAWHTYLAAVPRRTTSLKASHLPKHHSG